MVSDALMQTDGIQLQALSPFERDQRSMCGAVMAVESHSLECTPPRPSKVAVFSLKKSFDGLGECSPWQVTPEEQKDLETGQQAYVNTSIY